MTWPTPHFWPSLRAFGTTNGVAARSALAMDTRPSWICVCFPIATSRNMRPRLHHGSEPGEGFGKACSPYITHEGGQRHLSSTRAERKHHISMHGACRPLSENRRSSESPEKRLPEKLSMFGEEDQRQASPGEKPEHMHHEGHHQKEAISMKLGIIPENMLERVALAAGAVPRPVLDTLVAMLLARTIMAATKLGIFEALASGPLPAHKVAAHCGTDPRATEKLLTALAGCGYVRAAHGQYALAPVARTWLLTDSPRSLRDKMLGQFTEW